MLDYYQVLGLKPSATLPEARAAYLRLAKELHPDLHPEDPSTVARFQEVQEAWQVLSQAEMREDYDELLHGFEDEGHSVDGELRLAERHASYREAFLAQQLLEPVVPTRARPGVGRAAVPILLALSLFLMGAAATESERRAEALHLAKRLSFGPRPEQLQQIEAMGGSAWIERQLDPQSISDEDCERRLRAFPSTQLSAWQLYNAAPAGKRKKKAPSMNAMQGAEMADQENKRSNQELKKQHAEWDAAKLTRLTYSERQFYEVMVDFWFNHFNVSRKKNQVKWLFGPYERDVIRPNALGRFDDLLLATAQSPAMLAYLDNSVSYADARYVPATQRQKMAAAALKAERDQAARGKRPKGGPKGLNENYARELLELHTLGVDGGYTQQDVIEAARVLTGWSYQGPSQAKTGGKKQATVPPFSFVFRESRHDRGQKTVLGHPYGAGLKQGEAMLDMLARHPATARYLATKLCRRFVADEPPAALIERVADAYLKADTDIRATLRVLLNSSEFTGTTFRDAKVKTPLEFVVSSLRTSDAEDVDWKRVEKSLAAMGQPLYLCEPPTGYADVASAWLGSSALLERMNFSVQLSNKKRPFAKVDLSGMTSLALGSPEFQRR